LGCAGCLDALGGQAERGGQPDQREREQHQYPGRGKSLHRPGGGAEPEADRNSDHDSDSGQGLDEAAQHVAGEDGCTGDGHGAEPVGEGPTQEAAIADLREALEVLLAEVGPPDELTLTVNVA
jgi:hypothetical protein